MSDTAASPRYTIEDSDELLLASYVSSGDRQAFEILMRRYEREIYSYLRRYIGNTQLAEDAFQSTFLQVHLKGSQFDVTRRFRPWLYAIATNQAIDAQRRAKRRRMVSLDSGTASGEADDRPSSWADRLTADTPDPHAIASGREDARWVNDAVAGLGDSFQRVIQLVYFQGLKYREAADILGIPVGTVKSRVHAAVQRLAAHWNETRQSQEQQSGELTR